MNSNDRLEELIIARLHDQLSFAEANELNQLLRENPEASQEVSLLQQLSASVQQFSVTSAETAEAFQRFEQRTIQYRLRQWGKYAALLLLPIVCSLFLLFRQQTPASELATTGVILQTADGSTINLSEVKATQYFHHSHVHLAATEAGELTYTQQKAQASTSVATFSHLTIPRGHSYKLQLCDGTQVWLNSETKLSYPEVFTSQERRVLVSGEALFEVQPETNRPFIVETSGMQIEVLGTKFNVNTHHADQISATLITGKIKAFTPVDTLILSPGEMVCTDHQQLIKSNADTTKVIAWTTGKLFFSDMTLEEVAMHLCRWHNINVEWKAEALKDHKLTGVIRRDLPVATTLEMLEKIVGNHIRMVVRNGVIEIYQE